jgi:hypothetical protein
MMDDAGLRVGHIVSIYLLSAVSDQGRSPCAVGKIGRLVLPQTAPGRAPAEGGSPQKMTKVERRRIRDGRFK